MSWDETFRSIEKEDRRRIAFYFVSCGILIGVGLCLILHGVL